MAAKVFLRHGHISHAKIGTVSTVNSVVIYKAAHAQSLSKQLSIDQHGELA